MKDCNNVITKDIIMTSLLGQQVLVKGKYNENIVCTVVDTNYETLYAKDVHGNKIEFSLDDISSEMTKDDATDCKITAQHLLEFINSLVEDDMWDEVVVKYPDGAIENIDRRITEEEENTQIYPRVKGELGTMIEQLRKKLTLVSAEYLNVPMQFCDCEPACATSSTTRYTIKGTIKEEERLILLLKEE